MTDSLVYPGIYRAKVLATDAAEDDKLGRIKVEVYPMLLGVTTARIHGKIGVGVADLPWAVPAMSLFSGAGSGYGCLAIPDVDSFVWVFFEAGDIYQPVYFAEAQTKTYGVPTEVLVDYPDTKVYKTATGIVITINKKSGSEDIKVLHPSGSYIQIDSSGDVNVIGVGNVNVTSTDNVIITGALVNINP